MRTTLQKSQQVLTPEGEGRIIEIIGENITVKLNSGEEKTFREDELLDDSDAG